MTSPRLDAPALAAALALAGAPLPARAAFASPSADELVRQARAHEAAHEDEVALRRQFVAGLEHTERELLADALADLLKRPARVDRPETRRCRGPGGAMVGPDIKTIT